jgi:hypothetical protein
MSELLRNIADVNPISHIVLVGSTAAGLFIFGLWVGLI